MNVLIRLLSAIFCLVALPLTAQQLSVKGIVKDGANDQVLSFATIRAFSLSDSVFVNGTVSSNDGSFQLQIPTGKYYMEIGFMGMQSVFKTMDQTSGVVDLGVIALNPSSLMTSVVSVIADKSLMELKLDKRVYNVSADLNNQGANATEVLENIPSITVDAEGNVSLRGNSGVRILIDGKYSGFSSTPEALQQLQADMIEKVEVVTNASSRYEAQGDVGIINIILKKNKQSGWNGSVNAKLGYFPEWGGGFNVNYKHNKVNFNLAYSFSKNENPNKSTTYQRITTADTAFSYHQLYQGLRKKAGHSIQAGMQYDMNSFNTLIVNAGIRSAVGNNGIDRIYENFNSTDELLFTNKRIEWNSELEDMLEASMAYHKRWRREGAEWTTEFKWMQDNDLERSDYEEYSSLDQQTANEKSHAYIVERMFQGQSDLVIPFAKEGKFEAGLRSQQRQMNNDFGFGQRVENNWNYPAKFNDDFEYLEQVHAAYVMGSNTFNRWSIQTGVRAEYSDITTTQASQNKSNHRQYMNLFPSAAISYKSNEKRTFQASYSRRINRPGQWTLMPFMKFGDNREMRIGNPNVNPELTDVLEAGVMQYFEKGSLLSTVYYRTTNHSIETMSMAGDDGIIYRVPLNVGHRNAYGFEFNLNYAPTSVVRITSGFNFYQQVVSGTFNEVDFEARNLSWTNRTSVNVNLKTKTRIQVSSNYEAPRVTPQGRMKSIFFMDAGLTQDIGKNATLGLNIRDVFNSRKWRFVVDTDDIFTETSMQWRPRSIRLVFTYRFNQKPNQQSDKQPEYFEGD